MATTIRDAYKDSWAYAEPATSEWEVAQNSSVGAGQIDKGAVSGWVPYEPSGQTTQGAILDQTPTPSPASSGGSTTIINEGAEQNKWWGTPANSPQSGPANSAANYPSLSNVTPWSATVAKTGSTTTGPSAGITPAQPYATVQTSKTIFKGKAPTFAAPQWDEREVRKKARKLAGPAMAKMEQEVQRAVGQYYENPNVRRMVLRDTLQGYGIGLAGVIASSEQAANAAYGQEYSRQFQTAQANYTTAWAQYVSSGQQLTTSTPVYTPAQQADLMKTGVK